MIDRNGPLNTPAATALASVASNSALSASAAIIRARIKLNVRAAIPSKSSSTPMAAFQSASTRLRRDVSASEVRSWVAHNNARIITDGGIDGRPIRSEYKCANSSSLNNSSP